MFRRSTAVLTLATLLLSPLRGLPADHIVSAEEVALHLTAAEQRRQDDIDALTQLFHQDAAQAALADAGIERERIQRAVSQLDDETLAHLAEQSRVLDADLAAQGYPGGKYFGLYVLAALLILFVLWGTVIADGGPA